MVQNPDSKDFVPFNGKSATVAIVPTYVKTQSFLLRTSPLVGVLNGVNVSLSGFSGLDYIPGSGNMFTTITDRGANASADVLNGGISTLVFPFPNFSPTIIQIAAESDSIRIVSTLPIKRPNGTPTTGVPPSLGFGNTGEAAWDLNFNPIPPDNYGIDCEGIAPGINNDYWVCEEYGTTVWNIDKKSGKLIRRYAPFQSVPEDILIDTVFKYRNPNKGFECLAVTPKGKVYAIVQQPLYWPNAATGDNSRTHRMLEIDPATGKTRMFAYVHELPTTNNKNSNWKLGDMTAINDYEFLVVEHSVKSGEDSKKVFKIDIRNATPISSENYGGKTIEGLDVSLFPTYGIVPVKKQLYFDALANGWDPLFQKPEGLTIMNDSTIAMTEDNDFSINSPNSDGTIINTNIPTRMYIFTMQQALKLNYIRIDKRINPRLSISPNILKVDSIDMGLTACRTITLTNPGTDPVRITKQYLSSNDGDFSFTPLTGKDTLLNPGDVRTIQVCFNPLQRGTRQGRISFKTDLPLTYETPRQDSSTISIELRGNGTPLGKLVGPMIFKRDSALVGTVICHIDTVYNQGSEYINIKSASVSGPDAADFSVSTVTPVSIAPSKYATFTICGTPSAEGNRIGKLDIVGTSNGKTVTTNIVLGLYGLKACATALPIVLFTEKKIAVGSADTQKIEVKNCGERPAIYSLSIKNDSTSSYTVLGATSTAPVNPLQSAFFTIRFAPTVKTSAYANAVVTSPGVPNMNITLSGTGASAKVIVSAPLVPPTPVGNTSSEFDLILTNVGNISWTPGMPSVNGPFVYRSGANQIIAPGADGKLTFAFVPQSLGTNDGSITFKQCTPTIDQLLKINLSGVGTSSSAVTDQEAPTFSLENNYPNPFSHQTTFTYELSKASFVEFSILSLEGNKLTRLVSQRESAGKHSVTFDASPFASGIYIYSLKTEYGSLSKQMNIVK